MGKERFSERQTAVLNAAARLDEVAALPETDIVRDAAIQRFEFTFELVWKTLQLYLEHEGLESSGPRAVLKRAFVIRLISDQDEADVWLQMLDDRNLTSHAYDETLAVRIYTRIVHDYAPRLARMAEKIPVVVWDLAMPLPGLHYKEVDIGARSAIFCSCSGVRVLGFPRQRDRPSLLRSRTSPFQPRGHSSRVGRGVI